MYENILKYEVQPEEDNAAPTDASLDLCLTATAHVLQAYPQLVSATL